MGCIFFTWSRKVFKMISSQLMVLKHCQYLAGGLMDGLMKQAAEGGNLWRKHIMFYSVRMIRGLYISVLAVWIPYKIRNRTAHMLWSSLMNHASIRVTLTCSNTIGCIISTHPLKLCCMPESPFSWKTEAPLETIRGSVFSLFGKKSDIFLKAPCKTDLEGLFGVGRSIT